VVAVTEAVTAPTSAGQRSPALDPRRSAPASAHFEPDKREVDGSNPSGPICGKPRPTGLSGILGGTPSRILFRFASWASASQESCPHGTLCQRATRQVNCAQADLSSVLAALIKALDGIEAGTRERHAD
jgi:hypothetical protein